MNGRSSVLSLLCGVAFAVGCGSSMDSAEWVDAPGALAFEAAAGEETLLAEFEAEGEHHAFLLSGNGPDATLVHRARRMEELRAFSSLEERAGQPLTMLEIFLALAPEGMTPPEELFEQHEAQALAWGRGTDILIYTHAR